MCPEQRHHFQYHPAIVISVENGKLKAILRTLYEYYQIRCERKLHTYIAAYYLKYTVILEAVLPYCRRKTSQRPEHMSYTVSGFIAISYVNKLPIRVSWLPKILCLTVSQWWPRLTHYTVWVNCTKSIIQDDRMIPFATAKTGSFPLPLLKKERKLLHMALVPKPAYRESSLTRPSPTLLKIWQQISTESLHLLLLKDLVRSHDGDWRREDGGPRMIFFRRNIQAEGPSWIRASKHE